MAVFVFQDDLIITTISHPYQDERVLPTRYSFVMITLSVDPRQTISTLGAIEPIPINGIPNGYSNIDARMQTLSSIGQPEHNTFVPFIHPRIERMVPTRSERPIVLVATVI